MEALSFPVDPLHCVAWLGASRHSRTGAPNRFLRLEFPLVVSAKARRFVGVMLLPFSHRRSEPVYWSDRLSYVQAEIKNHNPTRKREIDRSFTRRVMNANFC